MSAQRRRREIGRAERVLPGIWRLRVPLPWPGVPHVNAWALESADGFVLVDTGADEPGTLAELERALNLAGWSLEQTRLLVCTHAHADHYGLAKPIVERAGCELWMHPAIEHMTKSVADPDRLWARRVEAARQCGVPEEPLERFAESRRGEAPAIAGVVPPSRELVDGTEVETDHGAWKVYETPGHAPSHIVLHQPELGVLITGDHLLGRVSPYFDFGWTPDPAGEFLASLDVIEPLGAKLCLSGHGKPFRDVKGHIDANRDLVTDRISRVEAAIRNEPKTAFEILPEVFGADLSVMMTGWYLTETLSYLTHLAARDRVEVTEETTQETRQRWIVSSSRGRG